MKTDSAKLTDGCEWADHEDCIVGDETGLRNLIGACEVALEEGEYYGSDLGDYVGVKKMKTEWFKSPQDSKQTRFANAILAVVLALLVFLIIIGFASTVKWLTS